MKMINNLPLLLVLLFTVMACDDDDESSTYSGGDEYSEFSLGGDFVGDFSGRSTAVVDAHSDRPSSLGIEVFNRVLAEDEFDVRIVFRFTENFNFSEPADVINTEEYQLVHSGPGQHGEFQTRLRVREISGFYDYNSDEIESGTLTIQEISPEGWIRGEFDVVFKNEEDGEITATGEFLSRFFDDF